MTSERMVFRLDRAHLRCCDHDERGERIIGWGGSGVRCDEILTVMIVVVMIVVVMTIGYAAEASVILLLAAAATHHSHYPGVEG